MPARLGEGVGSVRLIRPDRRNESHSGHTGGVEPEPTAERDLALPSYYRRIKGGGAATVALGAAMVAVGEILEPEKTTVEIEQTNDDPLDGDIDLSFGQLPDLN